MLNIANNLSLPLDFVTERTAFLARTGAGKSGAMRVLAEEMLDASQFIIFLDPKGDAWGVRSDYSVLIMGGDHADIPLQATAGKFVADFLVRERISTVLDVSHFSEADMVRFVGDFAEQLYRTNKEVVHLFLDEADEFAPQSGYNVAQAKCLGAIQRVQRRGRGRGIGVTLATQRSAVINKSVLTQAGTLIAMQTTAPHDLKAVDAWLEYAATKEARNEIMSALPSLKPREAFVYSPQLLGSKPQRIKFRAFKSFDSMRTPKHGESIKEPKKLADLDLTAIKSEMSSTLEEIKQNDPTELKKQIVLLKKELSSKVVPVDITAQIKEAVDERDKLWKFRLDQFGTNIQNALPNIIDIAKISLKINDTVQKLRSTNVSEAVVTSINKAFEKVEGLELSRPEIAVLQAFYWLIGETATPTKVAFYSGYSVNSSGFKNTVSQLRTKGYIDGWTINVKGQSVIHTYSKEKPTGPKLREWLRDKLSKSENAILDVLLSHPGKMISYEQLSVESQYSASSSGFKNSVSRLRTIEAIEGNKSTGLSANAVFI